MAHGVVSNFDVKLARVGLRKRVHLYSDKNSKLYEDIVTVLDDNQAYTEIAQLGDFGMAGTVNPGAAVFFDDWQVAATKQYTPLMRAVGFQITEQADYTDIYKEISRPIPKMMLAMGKTREQVGANLINNAFSTATANLGPDGVALASTAHPLQSGTASNRPATDIALGILALEQAIQELMQQKTHRGDPEPSMGPFCLYVPTNLAMLAERLVGPNSADTQPQTADRENNVSKKIIRKVHVNPYFTSTTQWSLRSLNDQEHGLFMLNRIPLRTRDNFDIDHLVQKFVIYEEYVCGNYNWRGFWSTAGA